MHINAEKCELISDNFNDFIEYKEQNSKLLA